MLATLSGAQLAGSSYKHPLEERTSPLVVGGDYITIETGGATEKKQGGLELK